MGVCCIVFDIDGMSFDFFMNFLNIEKKFKNFFFQNFMFSSRFMLFPTLKKKNWCTKKFGGGGGGIEKNKILRIFVFKISCFLHVSCYFQH